MRTTLKRIGLFTIMLLTFISFTMPISAVSFKDVANDRWSYNSIERLVELGILNGFPDQTFRPDTNLTRAQGAIIIGKALDADPNQPPNHTFTDVTDQTVGYEYIHALTNIGIFDKAQQFNPTAPLTRAQMAKVLSQAYLCLFFKQGSD